MSDKAPWEDYGDTTTTPAPEQPAAPAAAPLAIMNAAPSAAPVAPTPLDATSAGITAGDFEELKKSGLYNDKDESGPAAMARTFRDTFIRSAESGLGEILTNPRSYVYAPLGAINSVGAVGHAFFQGLGAALEGEFPSLKESQQYHAEHDLMPAALNFSAWSTADQLEFALGLGIPAGKAEALVKTAEGVAEIAKMAVRPMVNPEAAMQQVRDLGIVGGEEQPPRLDGPPADAAKRAMAHNRPDETVEGPEPAGNPWEQRFEHFVGKLDRPEDIKDLVRQSAQENDGFTAARAGEIPLRDFENLANAAGVEPSALNRTGVGRLLQNDRQVRFGMQAMLEATEQVKHAAIALKSEDTPENLIALQAAIMRRDMAVEGVVGLRAEWGRTGNVFQEFMQEVKDQQALSDFLKQHGRDPKDMQDIADGVLSLDQESAARFLDKLKRTPPGWVYYTWVNGLISGEFTHTKYIAANALLHMTERGMVTPLAAAIDKLRAVAGQEVVDPITFGEAAAGIWGSLTATPSAIKAAARTVMSSERMALRSELAVRDALKAKGEPVPVGLERRTTELQPLRPTNNLAFVIPADSTFAKIVSTIIGKPGDIANGIHLAFKLVGERGALEAGAWRQALQDSEIGYLEQKPDGSIGPQKFWDRFQELRRNPTDDMLETAVKEAYSLTYMEELGPLAKRWQSFINKVPAGRWLFPFNHIPINVLKWAFRYTPVSATPMFEKVFGVESEAFRDFMGRNGQRAQSQAIARITVGSSVLGYFAYKQMQGEATGDAPRNAKDRQAFYMAGKQPNSILVGDRWYSFSRFGSAGIIASLGANFGDIAGVYKSGDDNALLKATMLAARGVGETLSEAPGFMTLSTLYQIMEGDERLSPKAIGSQLSSAMPFSALLGQTASFFDPYMRQSKTILDSIKYRTPGERQELLPARDWNGRPILNPKYHSVIGTAEATPHPADAEFLRLGAVPGRAQNRFPGNVKLSPEQFDEYVAKAGVNVDHQIEAVLNQPYYQRLNDQQKLDALHKIVKVARQQARVAMQTEHPGLVLTGTRNRAKSILGH
jgi:hypothetical protein